MVTQTGQEREYRQWRNEVYECLYDAGLETVATDWLNCSTNFATFEIKPTVAKLPEAARSVYVCADNPAHFAKVTCFTCHCRACPDCARRESARLLKRYMPLVDRLSKRLSKRNRFRHIVLTTALNLKDENAKSEFERLSKLPVECLSSLLPADWRERSGFVQAAEFGTDGLKLHFHIFFFGHWIGQAELAGAWEALTGYSIVWIEEIEADDYQHELVETLKYSTKFWSRDEDGNVKYIPPHLIPKLLEILHKSRRIRSYGVFFGFKDTQEHATTCPCCNGKLVRWSPLEWEIYAQTGWNPDEQTTLLNLKLGNNSSLASAGKELFNPSEVPKQRSLLL